MFFISAFNHLFPHLFLRRICRKILPAGKFYPLKGIFYLFLFDRQERDAYLRALKGDLFFGMIVA
jgi:hypothetical protein